MTKHELESQVKELQSMLDSFKEFDIDKKITLINQVLSRTSNNIQEMDRAKSYYEQALTRLNKIADRLENNPDSNVIFSDVIKTIVQELK